MAVTVLLGILITRLTVDIEWYLLISNTFLWTSTGSTEYGLLGYFFFSLAGRDSLMNYSRS